MVHTTSPQPWRGCHLGFHACKSCHQSKRGTPPTNQRTTCGRHMDWRAHEPNHLKTPWTPGTAMRTHLIATTRKHNTRGPTGGRSSPRIGWTDLGSVDPGLPRGASLLVLQWIPAVFGGALTPVPGCVNRRRGGSFLSNSLCNPSHSLLVSKPRR
jgi:hypothetical protein